MGLVASGRHRDRPVTMADIVLRVRLVGGGSMDVTYDDPAAGSEAEVIAHVVTTLADDAGVLRCSHGNASLFQFLQEFGKLNPGQTPSHYFGFCWAVLLRPYQSHQVSLANVDLCETAIPGFGEKLAIGDLANGFVKLEPINARPDG